ncbi:MAG: family 20 glycosylhydrolase [Puia sp.]|nr:family 20 glycosylhydrolase [Puia sp.]
MRKLRLFLATSMISVAAWSQQAETRIAIIPEPVRLKRLDGYFRLPERVVVAVSGQEALKNSAEWLKRRLSVATGHTVAIGGGAATIRLLLNGTADKELGSEGYRLTVGPGTIIIKANNPAGIFYGIQTLVQLFPPEIESASLVHRSSWQAPCVEITDYPRFAWRGLMLDVSRHFFTKEEVESYIDQMARYKFNLFHWHLTDDEGWRVEIKSLPSLTTKGAWRVHKVGQFGTFSAPLADEPRTEGGFYSQEDIREVVQYAKDRFVDVLPEVDVPGHSLAAIASYPELSCTPGADKYEVGSGEPFMNWTDSGNIALVDNTLCPANEKSYAFLDKVFTEIAGLFPFPYIHVGGDECAKNFWQKSDAIRALMQQEGLKNMREVQSYFEKRVEKIVESKGKKMIGWDEILEGGLAPGAAVMSWRGEQGGVEAARLNHEVVMSPTTYTYLDYMQGDPIIESHVYATLRLDKAYSFEPVPAGADPRFIKGGQGNLWTEQVYNIRHAEYMTWPRAFAIAESVWSPREKKSWSAFIPKVEEHFRRFDIESVKYAPCIYDPVFTPKKDEKGRLTIAMSTEIGGLDIYYTFDNSFPDRFYPKYTGPLLPPKDATTLRVITYRGAQPMGRLITMPLKEMEGRLK